MSVDDFVNVPTDEQAQRIIGEHTITANARTILGTFVQYAEGVVLPGHTLNGATQTLRQTVADGATGSTAEGTTAAYGTQIVSGINSVATGENQVNGGITRATLVTNAKTFQTETVAEFNAARAAVVAKAQAEGWTQDRLTQEEEKLAKTYKSKIAGAKSAFDANMQTNKAEIVSGSSPSTPSMPSTQSANPLASLSTGSGGQQGIQQFLSQATPLLSQATSALKPPTTIPGQELITKGIEAATKGLGGQQSGGVPITKDALGALAANQPKDGKDGPGGARDGEDDPEKDKDRPKPGDDKPDKDKDGDDKPDKPGRHAAPVGLDGPPPKDGPPNAGGAPGDHAAVANASYAARDGVSLAAPGVDTLPVDTAPTAPGEQVSTAGSTGEAEKAVTSPVTDKAETATAPAPTAASPAAAPVAGGGMGMGAMGMGAGGGMAMGGGGLPNVRPLDPKAGVTGATVPGSAVPSFAAPSYPSTDTASMFADSPVQSFSSAGFDDHFTDQQEQYRPQLESFIASVADLYAKLGVPNIAAGMYDIGGHDIIVYTTPEALGLLPLPVGLPSNVLPLAAIPGVSDTLLRELSGSKDTVGALAKAHEADFLPEAKMVLSTSTEGISARFPTVDLKNTLRAPLPECDETYSASEDDLAALSTWAAAWGVPAEGTLVDAFGKWRTLNLDRRWGLTRGEGQSPDELMHALADYLITRVHGELSESDSKYARHTLWWLLTLPI